jgi:DNA mismatch repair protein MutS2
MEATLARIEAAERERAEALDRARAAEEAAAAERERARSGMSMARKEAADMLADARRAADELLGRAEREVAEVRREVTRQRNLSRTKKPAAAEQLDELQRRAERVRAENAPTPEVETGIDADVSSGPMPRVGLHGRSRTLGTQGRIAEISGRTGRVTLETGEMRVVVPAEDVEIVAEPIPGPAPRDLEADELRRRAAERVSPQLDLRGERVEAALEQLDGYLDEALLAGLDEVRIIHGSGTGALRRSIRERLAEHPRVRATRTGRREEGGDGATIAEL